ncbi:MAG: hypothetical protein JRG73_15280 [Deltaproteobacteria bacterium]|nr:hypothetical protein [Deltaproteobacteria bacterium]MBW2308287.1 hypothetical protein [Deltaproteobacteria bacterium]
MEEKFGKVLIFFNVIREIAVALDGISNEMKRFNDLQEYKLKAETQGAIKQTTREKATVAEATDRRIKAVRQIAQKKAKGTRTPKGRVPDILYNSIIAISRKQPEFLAREVITHAMKSAGDSFQKQSLNTALQGFKVGSKTAERQPAKCRNLIVSVEGHRGLYRLNPEKMTLLNTEKKSSTETQ